MTLHVRLASMTDLESVARLFDGYRQFYGQSSDLSLAQSFIRQRLSSQESVIFIAEDGQGAAIGFTQLYPSFSSVSACRIWILNDLFTVPAMRGQGTGRALLHAAREHAVATGAQRLTLSTAHDNPAQKLYESLGYVRDNGFYIYNLTLNQHGPLQNR